MIVIGGTLIAGPQSSKKAAEGKLEDIVIWLGCLECSRAIIQGIV